MGYITEEEVRQIIDTTLTTEDVAPFLMAAETLVANKLAGEGYGAAELKEITRWLSAHFVAIRDPRIAKEKMGDADATYQGKTGMGLNHTSYGQQVMLLEHHGVLAALQTAKGPAVVKAII